MGTVSVMYLWLLSKSKKVHKVCPSDHVLLWPRLSGCALTAVIDTGCMIKL